MYAALIGITLGLLIILVIVLLKKLNKPSIYSLILSGIGFLYVGYTWTDNVSLIITAVQSIVFLFIAYYGIRNLKLLAAGYFLHGIWDLMFDLFPYSKLIPPHYDLFCLSIDFTIGFYLILLNYQNKIS
jgi:hypothetical protein